jgi:hypothetical protein
MIIGGGPGGMVLAYLLERVRTGRAASWLLSQGRAYQPNQSRLDGWKYLVGGNFWVG